MIHETFMKMALQEAEKGKGKVSPNPLVGSVLIKNGKVLATGFHGEMGKLHAERVVLEKVKEQNIAITNDCILYVSLEPCCHHGKTPPCTDAILTSGIQTVVIAQMDPNPLVAGKGINILRDAGIEVIEHVLEKEAEFHIRFFRHWITKKQPYFIGKLAVSLNGVYAVDGKPNFPISSSFTKQKTREMRSQFDAILVGKKTLLTDNPNLGSDKKDPIRIIFCQTADFSVKNLQVFRNENVLIACKTKTENCDFEGGILFYSDWKDFQNQLFEMGMQSVLVEGGGEIIKLFLEEHLLQEFHLVQSKKMLNENGKIFLGLPQECKKVREEDFGDDVFQTFCKV